MNNKMECVAYLFGEDGLDKLRFDIISVVNYAFAIPTKEGNVLPLENPALVSEVMRRAHAAGAKVCLSLGGWCYGEAVLEPTFREATATVKKRRHLAQQIVTMAESYGFDGVDVDWEYPRISDGSKLQFEAFLQLLRNMLPRGKRLLTAAILAGVDSSGQPIQDTALAIDTPAVELLDRLNLMTYDCDGPVHSSYEFTENCLSYWLDVRRFPPEKLTLGLPFYGRPAPGAFRELLALDADALEKDAVQTPHGEVFYNGRRTLEKKVALAKGRKLAGIMFWELSLDADDPENSLLMVLKRAME